MAADAWAPGQHLRDGRRDLGVNRGGEVFRCAKPCDTGSWEKKSGRMVQVSGGLRFVWGVNVNLTLRLSKAADGTAHVPLPLAPRDRVRGSLRATCSHARAGASDARAERLVTEAGTLEIAVSGSDVTWRQGIATWVQRIPGAWGPDWRHALLSSPSAPPLMLGIDPGRRPDLQPPCSSSPGSARSSAAARGTASRWRHSCSPASRSPRRSTPRPSAPSLTTASTRRPTSMPSHRSAARRSPGASTFLPSRTSPGSAGSPPSGTISISTSASRGPRSPGSTRSPPLGATSLSIATAS